MLFFLQYLNFFLRIDCQPLPDILFFSHSNRSLSVSWPGAVQINNFVWLPSLNLYLADKMW